MPNPIVALLDVPGSPRFSAAGFLARLPISMEGIAIVLLVSAASGQYAKAGLVSATFSLSAAALQPQLARIVDQRGQSRVAPVQVVLAALGTLTLVALSVGHAPLWSLLVAAAVGGGFQPSIGPMVRARWAYLITEPGLLRAAFSLESVIDEIVFVVGPPLAVFLASSAGPPTAVRATVAIMVVGTALLLVQRGSEPPPRPASIHDGVAAIRRPVVRFVVVMMVMMGGLFGAQEIATVGFAGQRGHALWAGPLLALAAVGSASAGLVYGSHPTTIPLRRQLVFFGSLAPLSVVLLPLTTNVWLLGVLMFVSGTVVAPMLICAFALVEASVPSGRLTEGLTWTVTGITLGYSLGAAVTGPAVDHLGTPHAYLVALGFGLLTALTVLVGRRFMGPTAGGSGEAGDDADVAAELTGESGCASS